MRLLLLTILSVLVVPVLGGSFRQLSTVEVRLPFVALGLFALQGFARGRFSQHVYTGQFSVFFWALISILLIVALIPNRHLIGLRLAQIGILFNLVVVLLNGAMPVSAKVASTTGATQAFYKTLGPATVVPVLGDVIPLPFGGALGSIGDILLTLSVPVTILAAATSRAGLRSGASKSCDEAAGEVISTSGSVPLTPQAE